MSERETAAVRADQLRTEYLENPIGCDEPEPRLSWLLIAAAGHETERGLAQSAYRVLVSSDRQALEDGRGDLWDSGKTPSAQSAFVPYGGRPLDAGERAWWSVQVWDQADRAADAAPIAFWETGLRRAGDWKAKWIGSQIVGGQHTEPPAPFLRKTFILPPGKIIASARLYATALGLYECHINGKKVGEDVFTPNWTDYRKRVQYQAYDVTSLLVSGTETTVGKESADEKVDGENVIGAILGDGWYCGYTGNIKRRQYYGDRPRFLGQLHIRFTDGLQQLVVSDESWTTATGPILSSDMMNGETYDARLEMPGWDRADFAGGDRWTAATVFADPGVPIVAMTGPTVRAMKELRPLKITPWSSGRDWGSGRDGLFIVDLGQNMVGAVRLRVKGPPGATIKMQFVEVLDANGRPYTENLRSAKQLDVYTLRGDAGGETFSPRFTFHGFRYVAISGYPGELTQDDITGVVMHSDMKRTGQFECSDPLVNQLQHNIEWGQRGNFLDVPTDCPQRDERLGWTGDAQVFIRTAAFNFDVDGFFAKWMQDIRDSQSAAGEYPPIVPNNYDAHGRTPPSFTRDGGPAWADAGIICPWTVYLCYGDRRLLERQYDSMVRFIDSLEKAARPFGLIRSHPDWTGWAGFGDWLSQDGGIALFGSTPKELIGTAFMAYDARLMATIANVLGKPSDASRFAHLAEETTAAFNRRYVTADGLIVGNTQTAYVLALHFDLLPEKLRPAAADALVRNIRANGNRLNTGFVGSPYLNHVLTRFGKLDVAYELLMQKNWPSWLYAVTHGATTIWERWDGWTHDKGFQDAGMNSFNHYAYGAIGDWLYQVVAGIDVDPTRPGYRHIILRPRPLVGGPLTNVNASILTHMGRVESRWTLDGNQVRYDVTLPPNTSGTVHLPDGSKPIGIEAGSHHFDVALRQQA